MEKLMLQLASSETGYWNAQAGLSETGTNKLCGYAFEHAKTKEEFEMEVVNYAENFGECARALQVQMKEEGGQKDDIAAITALLMTYKKGINLDKLRVLAGEEWDDVKEAV